MAYPLEQARKQIQILLEDALSKLKYKSDIKLEIPPEKMGDYSLPCFTLASKVKKSPQVIAQEIKNEIKENEWVERVKATGGYINFFLNDEKLLNSTLKHILTKKQDYGKHGKKGKKVIIEHTSSNPNGPLHVGRARNPIIGDTIVRIFKSEGYKVQSQFYLDDMGKQVAILTWGVNNLKKQEIPKSERKKEDHIAVGYYQAANKLMEKDTKISKQIGNIIKKSEEGEQKTISMVHNAYNPVLKGIKKSLKRINIQIDKFVPESKFVKDKSVNKVVKQLKKTNFCKTEDGAYYLDLESFGVQGRNTNFFFLRKDGTTLYATRDIAYHMWKAKQSDILVNILGEDHKLESKQVEIALNLLDVKPTPKAIFYSFVSLPGGKMSTRRGRVVYLDDLIEECIQRAYEEVKKRRGKELSEQKMRKISEKIGIGSLRYNIIKVQPEKDIVFKWEDALNFEGNSSPFIQYAHARACSILRKKQNHKNNGFTNLDLTEPSEILLVKKLAAFPEVIKKSCQEFRPHNIAMYLFELASSFNQFYRDCPVLPEKNKNIRNSRLALVEATKIVLRNGLNLLGIEAPEEM